MAELKDVVRPYRDRDGLESLVERVGADPSLVRKERSTERSARRPVG